MHFIILPISYIYLSIGPFKCSSAMNYIGMEMALVNRSISKNEFAKSVFLALVILALICSSIKHGFWAKAMLLVLNPIASVSRAIYSGIDAFTLSFVMLPRTLIFIAMWVVQGAEAMCLVI